MDTVNNQLSKIFITLGLLFIITLLGEVFLWNMSYELGESTTLLWSFVIIPAIIIAIIGIIAILSREYKGYRSFFRIIFIICVIIHTVWSIFSIWFYDALSSVKWL